jgi:hypothetical protein
MKKYILCIFTLAIISSCKETTKNYLDFKYSKVIAFASSDRLRFGEAEIAPPLHDSTEIKIETPIHSDSIVKRLNPSEIEYLNEILSGTYNERKITSESDCFEPRHGIAFLNSKDSVIQYIYICFECNNNYSSKPHSASMDNFRVFFKSIGLPPFEDSDRHKEYYDSLNLLPKKPSKTKK